MSETKDAKSKKSPKDSKKKEEGKPTPPKEETPHAAPTPAGDTDNRQTITVMDEYSDEQLEEIKMCFTLFDKNATDTVPYASVIDILRSLGLAPLEADMKKIGEVDGLIGKECSFEQFVSIFHHFITSPQAIQHNDVIEAFNTVADQNGKHSKQDMYLLQTTFIKRNK